MKQINQLNYLDRVVKETLRYYPSITLIGRDLKEDIQIGNEIFNYYIIKKNFFNFQNHKFFYTTFFASLILFHTFR